MYRVVLSGDIFGTFLTYDEAFDYVGFCMVNDIEEFGRPRVYQILHMDSEHVLEVFELDNDLIEPPCRKPIYSSYGCLGCTKCKEDDGFAEFEELIDGSDVPF